MAEEFASDVKALVEHLSKNPTHQAPSPPKPRTKNIDPSKPICCQKDLLKSFCLCGLFLDECTTCSCSGEYMGFFTDACDDLTSMHIIFPKEVSMEEAHAILSSIRPDIPSTIAHPYFIQSNLIGCPECDKKGANTLFDVCSCFDGDHDQGPTFTPTMFLNIFFNDFDDYHVTIALLQETLYTLIKDHGCKVTGYISWGPFSDFNKPDLCDPSDFGMLIAMGDRLFRTDGVKEIKGTTNKRARTA